MYQVVNDFIMGKQGSFDDKIMKGIENATNNGMRVSANMVISKSTYKDVYETARLAASKDVKKYLQQEWCHQHILTKKR